VPWSKILENIYCNWAARKRVWHPEVQVLNQARRAHGIPDTLGSFTPWVKDVPHICPSLPSIDLPMKIPPNVYNCGPILLSTPPIDSSDPDLLTWLKQRPTVLMVLGTHFEAYAETLREQAIGLHMLLEARPDIQVLWKLKAEKVTENSGRESVNNILEEELKSGRVRIEGWLKADPVAIMTSGHVVCAVHHGGANSYFEAAWYGVPIMF
jgi:UDP:flavonoid glycosyltransferase YjiC (YdhE family)